MLLAGQLVFFPVVLPSNATDNVTVLAGTSSSNATGVETVEETNSGKAKSEVPKKSSAQG